MTTCETCHAPIANPSAAPNIMSQAGLNQVRVKAFCSPGCKDAFVAALVRSATCAWCDGPILTTTSRTGGLGEPYCSEDCFSAAGRAMFVYFMR
jgi:hypothetical protein